MAEKYANVLQSSDQHHDDDPLGDYFTALGNKLLNAEDVTNDQN